MRKILFCLFLLVPLLAVSQTHAYCPLDGTCSWTGVNTFSNLTNFATANGVTVNATTVAASTVTAGVSVSSPNLTAQGASPSGGGCTLSMTSAVGLFLCTDASGNQTSLSLYPDGSKVGRVVLSGNLEIQANNFTPTHLSVDGGSQGSTISGQKVYAALVAVTYSATPIFDARQGNTFKITLTNNVTSSTLVNASAGQVLAFIICQDSGGAHTVSWPTQMRFAPAESLGTNASTCSTKQFVYDGSIAWALGQGSQNITP